MRPLFSTDMTLDKQNEELTGQEFITATLPKEHAQALDRLSEEMDASMDSALKKFKVPVWQTVAAVVSFILVVVTFRLWFDSVTELGFAGAYTAAPLYFYLLPGAIALAVVFGIITSKAWKAMNDSFSKQMDDISTEELEAEAARAYELLGVPEDAPEIDVFSFDFLYKNDTYAIKSHDTVCTLAFRAYVKDKALCLADTRNVFAFPLSSLAGIQTIQKKHTIFLWSKDTPPTDEAYAPYKLKLDDMENVIAKYYHALTFVARGEEQAIYFPCYELPIFERLTGLTAKQDSTNG